MRLILALVTLLASAVTQAALVARAPLTPGGTDYQAYYDTDLQITWLTNANLPASQTFGLPQQLPFVPYVTGHVGATGMMDWPTAHAWLESMNSAAYLGMSGWRLPTTGQPDPTCSQQGDGESLGYGCTGSEMGHLFFEYQIYNSQGGGGSAVFSNVQNYYYWSGTDYGPDPTSAWWIRPGGVFSRQSSAPKDNRA